MITLIVGLVIVGLILWVLEQIPMDAMITRIIRVVIIVVACIWLLQFLLSMFGGGGGLLSMPSPRIR